MTDPEGVAARSRLAGGAAAMTLAIAALLSAGPAAARGGVSPPPAEAVVGSPPAADTAPAAARDTADGRRPPSEPPNDWVDVVAFPFRVATFPLELLSEGVEAALTLVGRGGRPSPVIVALNDVRGWGLHPGIGSAGPRSGTAASLHLDRYHPLHLRSAVSIRGSQMHEGWLELPARSGRLRVRGWFRRWAEPHFWGVGPRTRESGRVDYRWDQWGGELELDVVDRSWIRLSASGGYEENQIFDGFDDGTTDITERFTPAELFGLGDTKEYARGGGDLTLDFAPRDLFQRRGVELGVGGRVFRGVTGTDSDFHRITARADGYLPLNPRQQLVLSGRAEYNRSDGGRGVPFFYLADLGDRLGGRAYTDNRFRGNDLAVAAAEYRWELWRDTRETVRLEAYGFFEEGVVARELSEVASGDWRPSYGFGLRLRNREGPVGTFYLADGDEGLRVQLEAEVSP